MKWIPIEEKHLNLILDWRTSPEITKFMYTDIDYDLEKQKKWLEKIKNDKNGYYWLIEYKSELIGFISITNIDWLNKRGTWNFYIGNLKYSMLAGFLGAYVYNFAFEKLNLEKLSGEVISYNEAVRKLHTKQGAREVGYLENHIFKYGEWHNVFLYEMTRERWHEIGKKYEKYVAEVII